MNQYERLAEHWRRVGATARQRGDRVAMLNAIAKLRAVIAQAARAC
jgi:hypothetical protein